MSFSCVKEIRLLRMYIVLASLRIYSVRRQAITRDDDDDDDDKPSCDLLSYRRY